MGAGAGQTACRPPTKLSTFGRYGIGGKQIRRPDLVHDVTPASQANNSRKPASSAAALGRRRGKSGIPTGPQRYQPTVSVHKSCRDGMHSLECPSVLIA